MDPKKLFKVVITAIVVKDGKYLVLQRAAREKKFPSRWTVPGGKLDTEDYVHLPKDTPDYWYNVLERTLRREVEEEAGIEIKNIRYVTSLADLPARLAKAPAKRAGRQAHDEYPSLVISCLADYASGEVVLDESMTEFRWVNLEEAKAVDLIDGIYEELEMADNMLNRGSVSEWKK
ncbi:MAG: NUDIX domain-containing protein [Patescibacteria group bacterium]|mgnify:CR=1 FL=1